MYTLQTLYHLDIHPLHHKRVCFKSMLMDSWTKYYSIQLPIFFIPRRKIRISFKCKVYQLYVEFIFIYLPKDDDSRVLIDCSVWPYLHTRRGENVVQCLAALKDWKSYNAKKFLFLTLVCFMLFYSLHNGFGTVVIFSWQSFVLYKILKSKYM